MEGLIHGVRSIAFSQQIEGRIPDWQIARQYAAPLAEKLIAQSFDINTLISINFPMFRFPNCAAYPSPDTENADFRKKSS